MTPIQFNILTDKLTSIVDKLGILIIVSGLIVGLLIRIAF